MPRYVLVISCSLMLGLPSCHSTEPSPVPPVQLEVVDLGVTEAWLKISVTDVLRPNLIRLRRDGQPLASFTMSGAETLIVDEHLLPNHTYLYEASRTGVIGQLEFPPLRVTTLDSTSHNFTWDVDLLGEAGPSRLSDVAIINDTLAYVVGEIYRLDSLGARDPVPYNMAKWNRSSWMFLRLRFYTICGQEQRTTYPARAIVALSPTSIWVAAGDQVTHWNGQEQTITMCLPVSFGIQALWAERANSLFAGGYSGTVMHYDGNSWQKLESGTNVDLRDVWGTLDGSEVWACGWNGDNTASVLLRKRGRNFEIRWRPSDELISSLWSSGSGSFVTTGSGRVYRHLVAEPNGRGRAYPIDLGHFAYRIRGAARDDLVCAGDLGMIWHYNGSSWHNYSELQSNDHVLYGLAMSSKLVFAVGASFSGSFVAALVIRGRR